jgi:hypothetical protein
MTPQVLAQRIVDEAFDLANMERGVHHLDFDTEGERILVDRIAYMLEKYGRMHYTELIDAETDQRISADGA